jgi:hypothetical protein
VQGMARLSDGEYIRGAYRNFPERLTVAPWGRPPNSDHQVACYTGDRFSGDFTLDFYGTGKRDLDFGVCNIAPQFSKPRETDVKVLRYRDRILVRVGIQHVQKVGYRPPLGPNFNIEDWRYVVPPEDGEVLLWANFDLEEATGVEGIRDVWPMGKIL